MTDPGGLVALVEAFGVAADGATVALAYFLWRFDRRLFRLEMAMFGNDFGALADRLHIQRKDNTDGVS